MHRRSSIARPSHPICVVSQLMCVRQPRPSQLMCAGNSHLLRVGPSIIARRYKYDLNIPWRHEVRIEDRQQSEVGKAYPACIGGSGACPPEDSGGPAAFMAGRDGMLSLDALEDLETMAEIIGQVALDRRPEVLDDDETRWRLESAVGRSQARERAQGRLFSRRAVNNRLRAGEHRDLMHQQY
jgi:Plasmid pRiA4b ORF-3-like protein